LRIKHILPHGQVLHPIQALGMDQLQEIIQDWVDLYLE
jgi:hypothetical protein